MGGTSYQYSGSHCSPSLAALRRTGVNIQKPAFGHYLCSGVVRGKRTRTAHLLEPTAGGYIPELLPPAAHSGRHLKTHTLETSWAALYCSPTGCLTDPACLGNTASTPLPSGFHHSPLGPANITPGGNKVVKNCVIKVKVGE